MRQDCQLANELRCLLAAYREPLQSPPQLLAALLARDGQGHALLLQKVLEQSR